MIPTRKEWNEALEMRHGRALHAAFSAATVAVCGLGGLGSNIAILLARAGIGRLILIDFDRVELTNLHRQQYGVHQIGQYKAEALAETLAQIAPYASIEAHTVRITAENAPSLLAKADVICEAFDRAEEKAMLAEAVLVGMQDKYLVSASGMAGMGSANRIRTRKITPRFYLSGDETSDVADGIGLIAPRVALCAAHQAHTVLRILAGHLEIS